MAQVHTLLLGHDPARLLALGCTLQGFQSKSGQEYCSDTSKICIQSYRYPVKEKLVELPTCGCKSDR